MKKSILLIATLILITINGFSQADTALKFKKNAVIGELGGSGIFASVKYQRIFFQKDQLRLAGSVGFDALESFLYYGFGGDFHLYCPIEAHALIGKNKHFWDLGLGHLAAFSREESVQNYIDYNAVSSNGVYYSTTPPEKINIHERIFNVRAGYSRLMKKSGCFWSVAWVPFITHKSGYRREPYDKALCVRGALWGLYRKDPIPQNYQRYDGPNEIKYKTEIYLFRFGFTVGYMF